MENSIVPEFDPKYGPGGTLFIGTLVSCFLFGITTLQAYIYYIRFATDRLRVKVLFELGHCICLCHSAYFLTVVIFGKPRFLVKTPTSLALSITISGVIASLVQGFFAERKRIVSRKLAIPILCWTLSAVRFSLSIATTAQGIRSPTYGQFQNTLEWLLTSVLSIGVAVDVVVTASLCHWFQKTKTNTLKRTTREIEKIMVWTIQTGLLTSVTGVIMLISFRAMPGNFAWLAIFASMARLYSNSLFATLNARSTFRQHGADFTDIQMSADMQDLDASAPVHSQIVFQRTKTTMNQVEDAHTISTNAGDSAPGDTKESVDSIPV